MHLTSGQGAVPMAPRRLDFGEEFEVPAISAFPGLLFIVLASFPNKDEGSLPDVQPVTKEP